MADKPPCILDDQPSVMLLNGAYFCESHAMCAACVQSLTTTALSCRCDRDGYAGHEELLYCSEKCLDAPHPDYDPGPIEEEEPHV